jgi:hypothetical protein
MPRTIRIWEDSFNGPVFYTSDTIEAPPCGERGGIPGGGGPGDVARLVDPDRLQAFTDCFVPEPLYEDWQAGARGSSMRWNGEVRLAGNGTALHPPKTLH